MSKSVRIRDHLYAEIEKLAKSEKRSLISQLEVLLEQALEMGGSLSEREKALDSDSGVSGIGQRHPARSESDFKGPDFK